MRTENGELTELHQQNKQKGIATLKDNCGWCWDCNVQEINTDCFFQVLQVLADLLFFFHNLIVYKLNNKLQIIKDLRTHRLYRRC